MNRKVLVISVLAIVTVTLLMAVSVVAVLALTSDGPAQTQELQVKNAFEVAPAPVEAPGQVKMIEPALRYEGAGHGARAGGCPYQSAKMQLTEAPGKQVESESLAQVGP